LAGARQEEEALRHIDNALRMAPGYPIAFYLRAGMRVRAGDDAAAQRDWEAAIRGDPTYLDAYNGLIGLALRKKDYRAADKILKDGLAALPEAPQLNNGLAWIRATCPDASLRNGKQAV